MAADLSSITDKMEVFGSDGGRVGRVDHVLGDDIELAKLDPDAGFKHHLIPVDWVARVDEHVHLGITKAEAKLQWREKT